MDANFDFDNNADSENGIAPGAGRGRGFVRKPLRITPEGPGYAEERGAFKAQFNTEFQKGGIEKTEDSSVKDNKPEDSWNLPQTNDANDGWSTNEDTNNRRPNFGRRNDRSNIWNSQGDDVPHGGGLRESRKSSGACYNCNEEGHLSRECTNLRVERSRDSGDRSCYTCKQSGHISRDCPVSKENKTLTCYNCNEPGHGSRECPNPKNVRSNRGGRGGNISSRGGSSRNCYNCGEEGHTNRECSKKERTSECRNCHKEGHLAKDCPEPIVGEDGKKREPYYIPKDLTEDEDALFDGISSGINFDKYENIKVKLTGKNQIDHINTFDDSAIKEFVLQNIKKARYVKPTPIQKYCIPIVLAERDLMACAQTGSGKTAAYMVPIVNYLLTIDLQSSSFETEQQPLAVILSPTRELAIQIYTEAKKFACGSIVKSVVIYGGTSVSHQSATLQRGCHILVATPGRLKDFVEKGKLSFSKLKFFVLDEADRMLDMGFLPDIRMMLEHASTPSKENRVTLMFSATFPPDIRDLAREFLKPDYLFVCVGEVGSANTDVEQIVKQVDKYHKINEIKDFLRDNIPVVGKVLVFVEAKRNADYVASILSQYNFPTTSIHGDRLQREREEAINDFKNGTMQVLVATAVAARGLDIKGVGCVVNLDLPKTIDEYVHRIGRTGRVGNKGKAVSYYDKNYDQHLAQPLIKILAEAQQVIPDWLQEEANGGGGGFGSNSFRGSETQNEKITESSWTPIQTEESWES